MLKWKKQMKIDYQEGDTRIVRRFLFWPVCIQDEWRWLGLALIKQKYQHVTRTGLYKWFNREWIDGR